MNRLWIIICLHQALFQVMFLCKNILLKKKLGRAIRGSSPQVNVAIVFFILFIGLAIFFSLKPFPAGTIGNPGDNLATFAAFALLATNLFLSAASLMHLKDSWRVGVIEEQKTVLVTTGVYRYSRNPYFVSYLLMFLGYAVLLQNIILTGLTIVGWIFVHAMIIKEESYLAGVHGDAYKVYCRRVSRYLFF